MSNPPPPFQPPYEGPPAGSGARSGAVPPPPSWQTSSSTALTPGAAPEKSSKRALMIIGAVAVVVLIIVVLVVALGGSDSSGGSSLNGKAAHDGLRTVLADSTFDEDGNDDLRVCPLGDLDDLHAAVAKAIDLDPAVGEGTDDRSAREEGDLPGFVSCQRFTEDESKVDKGPTSIFFQAVLDPPRDYEGYITDFAGDVTDVNFDDTVEYKGGTVHMFCATASEDAGFTGCDADWVDTTNKIALNMFLGGGDASSEDTFTALKAVLPMMAASLAELAGNES